MNPSDNYYNYLYRIVSEKGGNLKIILMKDPEETNEEAKHDQRTENERKKLILSLEHGENFIKPIEQDLPPDIEGQWLDYIQQFEKQFSKRKQILIYDLIGRPVYRKASDIPDEEIANELTHVKQLLTEKAVTIDTICAVEDRELYRFITEELFNEKTNDIQIEGMTTCFIYEEFHPNHEYDIRNRCNDFVNHILNKKREWMPDYLGLAAEVVSRSGIITGKEVIEKIRNFRDSFESFIVSEINIHTIQISDDKSSAEVACHITYSGILEDTTELMTFAGPGSFSLKNEENWWDICRIDIPGISI